MVIEQNAQVDVTEIVQIESGGTLQIGAGAVLRFAAGTGLSALDGGQLSVLGTPENPVRFTSAAPVPHPGDWGGLRFQPGSAMAHGSTDERASVLEHVIVEFGGHRLEGDVAPLRGGVVIRRGNVALRHVELRHNEHYGLSSIARPSLEDVRFGPNGGRSALVNPELVPNLGRPPEAVVLHGAFSHSVTLPALAQPYLVEQVLAFYPADELQVLTIERGATIKFRQGGLRIGATWPAKLVAHGVTFTSAHAAPAPGDWEGISVLGENRGSLDLEDCVVEYAGLAANNGRAAILFPLTEPKQHRIVNCLFRYNSGPALDTTKKWCAPWEIASLNNRSLGQPFCAR